MAAYPSSPPHPYPPMSTATPVSQFPYMPNPYGSIGNESASFMPPPPPYTPAIQGNNYQGSSPAMLPPPYPADIYGGSNSKSSGNSPMPQLPYPLGPNESNDPEVGDTENLIDENAASAPPLESIEKIPGYEHVTFDYATLAPPPASEWPERPAERENVQCLHQFSKEEVQSAVRHCVAEHCCYGGSAAKEMDVTDVVMSSVYRYILESFGEKRESAWCFVPYTGQVIDGPNNGRAPGPWEIAVHPKQYFQDSKTKMEIPHTAVVKPCHGCNARGHVRCSNCMGMGRRQCNFCHGRGRTNNRGCTSCHSTGRKRCFRCHGRGKLKCRKCDGRGQLKGFFELSVTWKNHFDDFVSESPTVPKRKIRKVTGQVIFEEKNIKVWPITHCGDSHVNDASNNLVAKHNREFPDERFLQQRHSLQIVPVANCRYNWKSKTGHFCVYGFQEKVYFPDYPQKYFCGCSIL